MIAYATTVGADDHSGPTSKKAGFARADVVIGPYERVCILLR